MDKQFDEPSTSMREGISRREALKTFGVGLAGAILAASVEPALAQPRVSSGQSVGSNGSYLVISSLDNDSVLRFDGISGAFVDAIVPKKNVLRQPMGVIFGPDRNLYVAGGLFVDSGAGASHAEVFQIDGISGAFLNDFADSNKLASPRSILFGPDGNLYVGDAQGKGANGGGTVVRYNGITGDFVDYFVAPGSGGLTHPGGMVFGPNGLNDGRLDLYVASGHDATVYRYDGTTGAFKGVFVPAGSGGLSFPLSMVFGPDGNFYVVSMDLRGVNPAVNRVLRYDGLTGAFLGVFIPQGLGGLGAPTAILFGPGGTNDGNNDLYVATTGLDFSATGLFPTVPGTNKVLRYDGTTGAFKGVFVAPDSGGLNYPSYMTFTETDPVTLNYGR